MYTLEQFAGDCRDALRADPSHAGRLQVVDHLRRALADPDLLAACFKPEQSAEREVIYRDDEFGFCICAHVYADAKDGEPHDHGPTWAIYGQAEGVTDMSDWRIVSAPAGNAPGRVEQVRSYRLEPGEARLYDIGDVHAPRRAGIVPFVAALFPIPKIALLPLFIIWFGIGEESKVATILFGTFFPTVIAVYGGVDGVDRGLIRMGQSFNLTWLSIVRKIVLPGALPAILSGCRISASIAIILLVAAEMIGAEYGIGAYVLLAGNLMATDQLIAGVALLSLLGLSVSWLIGRLERALLRWRG